MATMNKIFKIVLYVFICFAFLIVQGCAEWKESGAFFRTEQTKLSVTSTPQTNVYLNNKLIGKTPLTTQLEYQQKINKSTRDVNYWVTEPGWSLFLTLISVGIYLPFSFIPVDTQMTLTPTGTFNNNQFNIRLETESKQVWEKSFICNGQPSIELSPELNIK